MPLAAISTLSHMHPLLGKKHGDAQQPGGPNLLQAAPGSSGRDLPPLEPRKVFKTSPEVRNIAREFMLTSKSKEAKKN